jgi:transposase
MTRNVVNGILWRQLSGAAWHDMPEKYGKWNSVYQCWKRWNERGTLENVTAALAGSRGYKLDLTTVRRARYTSRKRTNAGALAERAG